MSKLLLQVLQIALHWAYVFCVYRGWMKSPSLSVMNENPHHYRARVSADWVEWIHK
jgi:hypothetical protein